MQSWNFAAKTLDEDAREVLEPTMQLTIRNMAFESGPVETLQSVIGVSEAPAEFPVIEEETGEE